MSRIAVVFTGGTISMLPDPETGAAVPSLDGAAILDRVPELHALAELEAVDWGLVPASHLSLGQILDLARLIETTLHRAEVDGLVVVQGTDTMEETAFAFDLLVGGDKPVVVTGAMRNAADSAWDGADNLSAAIRVAASQQWRGAGTLVVMGGSVLPADDATKLHSQADDAFGAPNAGRLEVRGARRRLERIPESAAEPVFLVTASVGLVGARVRELAILGQREMVI
ncbi:MAG: asparaginase, partial [Chloroflexi bacterium]|nr:asparaginase [Chloroflexota bacterium]